MVNPELEVRKLQVWTLRMATQVAFTVKPR